jgi:hypothetical protein
MPGGGMTTGLAPYIYNVEDVEFIKSFEHVGEAIWTLLFALLGGLVGACAARRRDTAADSR